MAKLNMFYCKSVVAFLALLILNSTPINGQDNCRIYPENSGERIACEISYRALQYKQGSSMSQLLFDHAIEVGPDFAYAYYQKSVPFFKRGYFAEGLTLIDKAIELQPRTYLSYRAYWYFYNRSFEYCIPDLEELYTVHNEIHRTTPGGDLEMRLVLAMAYAQTGNVSKGIEWIVHLMDSYKEAPYLKGLYDHFCLGVLYFQNDQLELAAQEFTKQLTVNDAFADTYYYLGLINEQSANNALAKDNFQTALAKMNRENNGYSRKMFLDFDTYKEDVEAKLEVLN